MSPRRPCSASTARPRTLEARAQAEAAITAAIAAVSAAREVTIHLHGSFARPPKPLDATQQRLFTQVEHAATDLGQHYATRESGGVCDGNNLAAEGLPVVDTLGARGGLIHSPQEYLLTDSLVERARLSAAVAPPPRRVRMSWHIRPARADDLDALHALSQHTGPGFTNIPQSYEGMAARLRWHVDSLKTALAAPGDHLYMLLLVDDAGNIGGTAMLFAEIGIEWPFYSYHITRYAQTSKALKRTITSELLNLTTEFSGASEVGGLFLREDLRAGGTGLGNLLARARYLFIAQHRARFGDRLIAELRGWLTPEGQSPFWDALGRPFFEMGFPEANRFNTENGNQFIADLMPKHPVYTVMLPESARAVMGKPHDIGAPAMRLLEREGFRYDRYIDIFDGGPTFCVPHRSCPHAEGKPSRPAGGRRATGGQPPHRRDRPARPFSRLDDPRRPRGRGLAARPPPRSCAGRGGPLCPAMTNPPPQAEVVAKPTEGVCVQARARRGSTTHDLTRSHLLRSLDRR